MKRACDAWAGAECALLKRARRCGASIASCFNPAPCNCSAAGECAEDRSAMQTSDSF